MVALAAPLAPSALAALAAPAGFAAAPSPAAFDAGAETPAEPAPAAAAAPPPAEAAAAAAAPVDPLQALRDELLALRRDYEQRLALLEARLAELTAQQQAAAEAPPPAPPARAPAATAAQPANYFNPAISVVGNFVAAGGHDSRGPDEQLPSASLSEAEVALQAVVDPYARADFFLAFAEEGVELEEGYITFTALPWRLLAKVGRQRVPFGKVNTLHVHNLPWADIPLPLTHLLGGDEGWKGDGLAVSRLIPLGDTFSELTLHVLRGDAEGLFAASRRSDLAYNGHWRLFHDFTEASNLDLGLSYARGPNDSAPDRDTTLAGLDVTWRWKPLRGRPHRSLVARGELMQSERDQPGGSERATGWFVAADWQLGRRWWVGGRLESSDRAADAAATDDGAALTLTFRPSELMLLRGQYRHRRYAERTTADELLLQLQFLIGAHAAHPF